MQNSQLRKCLKKAAAIVCVAALAVTAVPAGAVPIASASAAQAASAVSDYQMYLESNVGVTGDGARDFNIGRNTMGYINHVTGNMALKIDVADGLSLVYNSQTGTDLRMGLGVTCNYSQTVEQVDEDTYVQTDWDGSRHYFKRLRGSVFRDDRMRMLYAPGGSEIAQGGCAISYNSEEGYVGLTFDGAGRLVEEEIGDNTTKITYRSIFNDEFNIIESVDSSKYGKFVFNYMRPMRGQLRLDSIDSVQNDGTSQTICDINITDTVIGTSGTLNSVKYADGNVISLQYQAGTHLLTGIQNKDYLSDTTISYSEVGGLTRVSSFRATNPDFPTNPPFEGADFIYGADFTTVNNVDGTSYTVDVWSGQ